MNDFNSPNLNATLRVTVAPSNKPSQFISNFLDSLPSLWLPTGIGISFSKSRFENKGKATILLPDVDKLLTGYAGEILPKLFTVKFIELVNQNFSLLSFSANNDKISFAINLFYKISNLPMVINDAEIRKTLSFYLSDSSSFLINPLGNMSSSKLDDLKKSVEPVTEKYLAELKKVKYLQAKTAINLTEANARWFIDFANQEIEKHFSEYFLLIKARVLQNLPDAVINDPRFRPSLTDAKWDEYDETIKKELNFYNEKFKNTPGYVPLDWRLVKAMIWTEILAGPKGNPEQWTKYPLQIGRFSADAGASVIKNGRENSDLITTPEIRTQFQSGITGKNNVRAGIAYLYSIAIRGKVASRDAVDNTVVQTYSIIKGDTIDGIVKKLGTTKENIMKNSGLNETNIGKLNLGQEIKYQKAHSERYITGWIDWKTAVKNYNGGGDANYMEKVERAFQIISGRILK